MTVKRQARSAWTKRANPAARQFTGRRGVAVHWPGTDFTISGHDDCLELLDRLERHALADRVNDYSALPYNQAACLHGYLIEGRGKDRRSGANGSTAANAAYGSVVALVPIDRKADLPQALLEAIRAALADQAPKGKLLTHADVRPEPTACPGPQLSRWIRAGAKLAPPAAPRVHVVQAGDTLWSLAERYLKDGARWPELAKLNGLKGDQLDVGQRLRLP